MLSQCDYRYNKILTVLHMTDTILKQIFQSSVYCISYTSGRQIVDNSSK